MHSQVDQSSLCIELPCSSELVYEPCQPKTQRTNSTHEKPQELKDFLESPDFGRQQSQQTDAVPLLKAKRLLFHKGHTKFKSVIPAEVKDYRPQTDFAQALLPVYAAISGRQDFDSMRKNLKTPCFNQVLGQQTGAFGQTLSLSDKLMTKN